MVSMGQLCLQCVLMRVSRCPGKRQAECCVRDGALGPAQGCVLRGQAEAQGLLTGTS